MKGSVRYIITRPCLSEGSVRLLKYLDALFPQDGQITLIDDRAEEHLARVDRRDGRVYGLRDLYARHNLGVNDVLMITPLAERRYQIECVVKPIRDRTPPPQRPRTPEKPQRVVVSESPYVREVRLERRTPQSPSLADAPHQPAARVPSQPPAARAPQPPAASSARETPSGDAPAERPAPPAREAASREADLAPGVTAQPLTLAAPAPLAPTVAPVVSGRTASAPTASAPTAGAPTARTAEPARASRPTEALGTQELLRELCSRVGYRMEVLGDQIVRLRADLGPQSYTVTLALDEAAIGQPGWNTDATYRAVLTREDRRVPGASRLTHDALCALIDNARLAPLSPLELRGYWNTGSFDLESAASVAELVSAQLSQRGVFSFVLLSLAQQPAHSVVTSARLAERLGSGANAAELARVLDVLCGAPFSALSPLGGGQYYLRSDISDVLRALGEYADGIRVRMHAETRVATTR